ncbi:MAG: DEAD/DEAH box helicase [Deltaproteobacteria bacterium]|nr:DEAD/DEAH box helicase [Deltaproteobacteria bacterium]MBT4528066.1 DEAD/DEAH box helicase [Deltaproteobacteria bacterium]
MTFNDLGIKPELEKALAKVNITIPMPVQSEAIPKLLSGNINAYVGSETGSGKTLAYLLPILNKLDISGDSLQIIIVAPTHELVLQIHQQIVDLSQNSGLGFRSLALIGSVSINRQKEKLKKKPHIVVGSPGRLLELIKIKKLKVHHTEILVMDEMDRLLDGAMAESIQALIHTLPRDIFQIFVSAASGKKALEKANEMAPDLEKVSAFQKQVSANITHLYFEVEDRKKSDLLRKIIHATGSERVIVFTHLIDSAEILTKKLKYHHIEAVEIHRDCSKKERQIAMSSFKSGKAQVLVSSDASARGLDIEGVTHVINLDPPSQGFAYVHRVGRTGRAGAQGTAITLINKAEVRLIQLYQKSLKVKIKKANLKDGKIIFEN